MIKKWSLTLICISALMLLAGCASNADYAPMASPSAMPIQSAQPMATNVPSPAPSPAQSAAAAASITSGSDALRIAEAIEDELEKLSEVDEAEVLVFGNVALVGVAYDNQYQGGTTTRIKDMVKERIGTVHNGITNVYVTDDPVQVEAIRALEEALEAGDTAFEDIQSQAQAIVNALKGTGGTTKPAGTAAPGSGSAT